MSIKWKVTFLLAATCPLLAGTTYAIQQWVVLPGFTRVEYAEARDDLTRCVGALRRDCEHLAGFAGDWAAWDHTWRFVEDRNQDYQIANLIPDTYSNNRLSLIVIVRTDGAIAWAKAFDVKSKTYIEAPDLIARITKPGQRLMAHEDVRSDVHGFLKTELGTMLIASRAIVTSDSRGPVRGALMMARLLTPEEVKDLSDRTRVPLHIWPIDDPAITPHDRQATAKLKRPDAMCLNNDDPDVLRGYTIMSDVYGEPCLLLRADMPRTIRAQGLMAARAAMGSSIAGGIGILGVVWLLLRRMIVMPLTTVTRHAVRVGAEKDLRVHINLNRDDELGVLAREFNNMIDNLAEYRAQLLDIARRAGMAEVAADVLHNVGNVLNTVNTSASVVTEKLSKSGVPNLGLAAKMLLEHGDDLGDFLARDERGRQLPNYISELAKFLTSEQEAMLKEMQTLTWAVEHIKQVISVQQVHSRTVAVIEEGDPVQVFEEAVHLNLDSFARHRIKLERDFSDLGRVPMDKHKVLQILVNLISNAKNSVKACGKDKRRIALRLSKVYRDGQAFMQMSVEDDGVGISAENLNRVFAFGFSTRKTGHGVGLHSAANMAQEMGGQLQAASGGPGKGATFTLELPIVRRQVLK